MTRAITVLLAVVAPFTSLGAQSGTLESIVLLNAPVQPVALPAAPTPLVALPLCRGHGPAGAAVGAGIGVIFGITLWSWQTSARGDLANKDVPLGDRIKAMALPVIAGAAIGFMLGESIKGSDCEDAPSNTRMNGTSAAGW